MSNKDNSFRPELRNIDLQEVRKEQLDTDMEDIEYCYLQDLKKERLSEIPRPTSTAEKYKQPKQNTVNKAVLSYKATGRFVGIPRPKRKSSRNKEGPVSEPDQDYGSSEQHSWNSPDNSNIKEDTFSTPKTAMKYSATPRSIEMDKSAERNL